MYSFYNVCIAHEYLAKLFLVFTNCLLPNNNAQLHLFVKYIVQIFLLMHVMKLLVNNNYKTCNTHNVRIEVEIIKIIQKNIGNTISINKIIVNKTLPNQKIEILYTLINKQDSN